MHKSRRTFLVGGASLASAVGLSRAAFAQAPAKLSETDPTALGLGYKEDATKVDTAKFPKYAAGQTCSNCLFYQGKAGDATGPCQIFPAKVVSAKGWCNTYTKKS